MQVTSVPFLFGLPGSVLLVGSFHLLHCLLAQAVSAQTFPRPSRLCQFVRMLPKKRDTIPHEAHKEFMPCQTAIMIDVVEVKDSVRFLRRQQAVSTYSTSNVAPTRGLRRLHWYSLTSPYKILMKMRARWQLDATPSKSTDLNYREYPTFEGFIITPLFFPFSFNKIFLRLIMAGSSFIIFLNKTSWL